MRIFLSAAILLFATYSQAGIFGPDNYEECVLDKMKGQAKSLIPIAKKACEKKFPYEKNLGEYHDRFAFSWKASSSKVAFVITENLGDYLITKIRVGLSDTNCMFTTPKSEIFIKNLIVEDGKIASFNENGADRFTCATVTNVWGILKN